MTETTKIEAVNIKPGQYQTGDPRKVTAAFEYWTSVLEE